MSHTKKPHPLFPTLFSSFPLSTTSISLLKPLLNLPSSTSTSTSTLSFFRKYPSLFTLSPNLTPQITPQFLTLHNEEQSIYIDLIHRHAMAARLCMFLMITKVGKMPLFFIDDFRFDLGLSFDYLIDLAPYFPEYFRVCGVEYNGGNHVGLELVKWRTEFSKPAILDHCYDSRNGRGRIVKFPTSFAPAFDLQKRVLDWQCLPYVWPYEDAFHLAPRSAQAEKWTVSVLHEIMSVLISKKTEMRNLLRLGDYLGFGMRFKKALVHYPGMFYISNKIRTQTVVLREAFRMDVLLENYPLMGMRHRYIYLMSKSRKGRKCVRNVSPRNRLEVNGTGDGIVDGDEEESDMTSDEEC